MVNHEAEQIPRKRGRSRHTNEKFLGTPKSLESRIIVCFLARSEETPIWENVLYTLQGKQVVTWKHEIDQQEVLYAAVDAENSKDVENLALRSHMSYRLKVANPSESLQYQIEDALRQTRLYGLLEACVGAVSKDALGVYLIYEGEDTYPLYVGQASCLWTRFRRRFENTKDPIGRYLQWVYRNPDRQETVIDGRWSLRFIPLEQALDFAVQGQLAPDLDSNPEARSLLENRYREKPKEGLNAAESALIAYFRPHLNQDKNTYPQPLPLHRQKYCQEDCSHHRGSSRSNHRQV